MGLSSPIFFLDILTLIVSVAMFVFALMAHLAVRRKGTRVFATTFALISIGIFLKLAFEGVIGVLPLIRAITGVNDFSLIYQIGILLSYFFVLSSYTLMLLVIEHIEKISVWLLVFLLVILSLVLADRIVFITDLLASIILLLLIRKLIINYSRKKTTNSLLVLIGFVLLLISHVSNILLDGDLSKLIFLTSRLIGFVVLLAVSWRILIK